MVIKYNGFDGLRYAAIYNSFPLFCVFFVLKNNIWKVVIYP